jgi:hypothetical protein
MQYDLTWAFFCSSKCYGLFFGGKMWAFLWRAFSIIIYPKIKNEVIHKLPLIITGT